MSSTSKVSVTLPTDEAGYLGRECPEERCQKYFKITPGTGLEEIDACTCPYCGKANEPESFATEDQIEYAKSVVLRGVAKQLHNSLKKLETRSRPRGAFGLSIKVKKGRLRPLKLYGEKELETEVTCSECSLRYAVYGAFAYCPDCGAHNNLQILEKNLGLIEKLLQLAADQEEDVAQAIVEDNLENCVSAFDGWGREVGKQFAGKAIDPAKAANLSFQNLRKVTDKLKDLFGIDLEAFTTPAEFGATLTLFQKRHVIAHRMGVVDEAYVAATNDPGAVVGRKIGVTGDEVRAAVGVLRTFAEKTMEALGDA